MSFVFWDFQNDRIQSNFAVNRTELWKHGLPLKFSRAFSQSPWLLLNQDFIRANPNFIPKIVTSSSMQIRFKKEQFLSRQDI